MKQFKNNNELDKFATNTETIKSYDKLVESQRKNGVYKTECVEYDATDYTVHCKTRS
jgi:hypothetical protein